MAFLFVILLLGAFLLPSFPSRADTAEPPPHEQSSDAVFESPAAAASLRRDPFRPLQKFSRHVAEAIRHTPSAVPATAFTTAVPIVNLGRLLIVEAELNRKRTVRLVVDTGASYTVLFPEVARDLGLLSDPSDGDLSLWTAGGEVGARIVTIKTVQVGGVSVLNLPVAVLGLPNPPEGIDGLLGLSFLNHFVVTLNPRTSQLHLKTQD
jgi:clan AA aspartic protease (TIGR02281 family)